MKQDPILWELESKVPKLPPHYCFPDEMLLESLAILILRQDAIIILRNKKNLREFHNKDKQKLRSHKVYVKKFLSPPFGALLGKCNSLCKRKK